MFFCIVQYRLLCQTIVHDILPISEINSKLEQAEVLIRETEEEKKVINNF
jgi:hypothetical protein